MNIANQQQWKMAFFEACANGEIEDLRHLCERQYLDKGWANIHVINDYGFRMACQEGHLNVVKYFLTSPELKEAGHCWADVNGADHDGFRWACANGHWDVVRWLIMDYGIKKTPAIKKIIRASCEVQHYFQIKQDHLALQSKMEDIQIKQEKRNLFAQGFLRQIQKIIIEQNQHSMSDHLHLPRSQNQERTIQKENSGADGVGGSLLFSNPERKVKRL